MRDLSENELLEQLKVSARSYLFMARHYYQMDTIDYMIEKWAELAGDEEFEDEEYEFFDYEDDPSCFLRIFSELVRREKSGLIENPDLKKAISTVRLIAEFEMAAADENEDDIAAMVARRILKTLDQPVPGRLRIFLGSWGLAPR